MAEFVPNVETWIAATSKLYITYIMETHRNNPKHIKDQQKPLNFNSSLPPSVLPRMCKPDPVQVTSICKLHHHPILRGVRENNHLDIASQFPRRHRVYLVLETAHNQLKFHRWQNLVQKDQKLYLSEPIDEEDTISHFLERNHSK
jgi:hypothetical protein